ncbi:hypothetical protein JKP88DRAFT_242549 [Tribonema minus]|uniref:Uncharacterized protein n=1 Tax=Tribonema minus TaxID=303371 RepID=A0A835YIC7_9STRA|nr:hypothetical protein JKP88DRAFT_242549 [Tribonema minus]
MAPAKRSTNGKGKAEAAKSSSSSSASTCVQYPEVRRLGTAQFQATITVPTGNHTNKVVVLPTYDTPEKAAVSRNIVAAKLCPGKVAIFKKRQAAYVAEREIVNVTSAVDAILRKLRLLPVPNARPSAAAGNTIKSVRARSGPNKGHRFMVSQAVFYRGDNWEQYAGMHAQLRAVVTHAEPRLHAVTLVCSVDIHREITDGTADQQLAAYIADRANTDLAHHDAIMRQEFPVDANTPEITVSAAAATADDIVYSAPGAAGDGNAQGAVAGEANATDGGADEDDNGLEAIDMAGPNLSSAERNFALILCALRAA